MFGVVVVVVVVRLVWWGFCTEATQRHEFDGMNWMDELGLCFWHVSPSGRDG